MLIHDFVHFTLHTIISHKMRSSLTAAGIAVGVTAVVLLTSIGQGIHQYVLSEFTQFGSHIVAINPGKTTTHGAAIGVFGNTQPLTIDDAVALQQLSNATAVVSFVQGNVDVETSGKLRRTTVYGTSHEFPEAFRFHLQTGKFLPAGDMRRGGNYAVLGHKLKQELFAESNPLGQRVRIGGQSFRVIGVMAAKGQVLGFDLDDTVYIPVATAMDLLNLDGLMEIDIMYQAQTNLEHFVEQVTYRLSKRHGREDFTITTQEQMLDVLGSILDILTMIVASLGAISLFVGGIGILTIMTISVTERTGEIGLLCALGAKRRHILWLFLGEATILAAIGGLLGLATGLGIVAGLKILLPGLPVETAWDYNILAELVCVVTGLLAGILPAKHAADLNPVDAMRAE
ncbi:MAG: ABC transporter permease [Thioalkalispiraceae bacterium]|jgi:putative ABC transport system permease protein